MEKINSMLHNNKLQFVYFVSLLLLLSLAMFALYDPYHIGADTMFHYNRISILMEALSNGSYPTYMDYGSMDEYGYVVNLFYPDLLLLPFAWIGNLTSANTAFISLLFTATLLTGVFSYWAVKSVYKSNFMASMSALLFTFAAYRIFDVFFRGAIGEYLAFTFIPLIFWGAYEIIKGNYKQWYILTIGFTLLIYTHVISSAIAFVVLLIFLVLNIRSIIKDYKRLLYLALAGLITIGLTLGYTVPMIEQMVSNNFYFTSNPSTDITYSLFKINDILLGMFNNIESPYKIAPDPKIGGVLIALLFLRVAIKTKTKQLKHIDIWVLIGLVFIFSASYSFPWHWFPFNKLAFIQHPSRLLLLVSFIFSLAGAYYFNDILDTKNKKLVAILSLTVVLILIMKSDGSSAKIIFKDHPKLSNQLDYNLTIGGAEYLPSRFPSPYRSFVAERGNIIKTKRESSSISDFYKDKGNITFNVSVDRPDYLELPLTYYIGYKANMDGNKIEYTQSENGLIELPINKSGRVEVNYIGTTLQKVSYYFTIIAIILFTIFVIVSYRRLKLTEKNKQL